VDALLCPACDTTTVPAALIGPVAVCGTCGTTIYTPESGDPIRATAEHIDALDGQDLATLRRARAAITRTERRQR